MRQQNPVKLLLIAGLAIGVASCSRAPRDPSQLLKQPTLINQPLPSAYTVVDVVVTVPRHLRVSEKNHYYPIAGIVWRGDLLGDRHAQVETIVDDAITRGVKVFAGPRKVVAEIEITRFHSLSERARYSFGGWHTIHFILKLRDAATGVVVLKPYKIRTNLPAYGGKSALFAKQHGVSMKDRIVAHLSGTIQHELILPGTPFPGEG